MKYILDKEELKRVAESFEISEDKCKSIIDRINNYDADVESSLFGEVEYILNEES